jgi:pyrroloquinoline quinone (PQQ) biosynthesis protein C
VSGDEHAQTLIDEIVDRALKVGREIRWYSDPLTHGRGRVYLLQHILRNRLLSAVLRPAWMSRCPDLEVVRKTIAQMRQELVMDDEIGTGHTTILWQMGRNIGLTDEEMNTVKPLPLVDVAFHAWENIARTRHWIAGWLSTSVDEFLLGSLPENNFLPGAWKKAFGLNDEQVFFFSYHTKADDDHAGREVWKPILRHVKSDEAKREILAGLDVALTAQKLFYEGICEAGDEWDRGSAGIARAGSPTRG